MLKYEIKTKTADPAGKSERYAWEATLILPDGTRKPVLRRRDQDGQPFLNSRAALADLRDAREMRRAEVRHPASIASRVPCDRRLRH